MNEIDARELAVRLVDSWPGHRGVDIDVWAEELVELDDELARLALMRLRRENDRPPTIARFLEAYRGQRRAAQPPSTETRNDEPGVAFADGARTARRAYTAECQRQGRAETWSYFAEIIDRLGMASMPVSQPRLDESF